MSQENLEGETIRSARHIWLWTYYIYIRCSILFENTSKTYRTYYMCIAHIYIYISIIDTICPIMVFWHYGKCCKQKQLSNRFQCLKCWVRVSRNNQVFVVGPPGSSARERLTLRVVVSTFTVHHNDQKTLANHGHNQRDRDKQSCKAKHLCKIQKGNKETRDGKWIQSITESKSQSESYITSFQR